MRVLQVVHALPPATYGGTELYARDLAEALAERGHEVGVATPRGGDADVQGCETFDLPDPGGETAPAVGERPLAAVERPRTDDRFAALLDDFDPDVVHCQHFKHLSASIPGLCAERGVPCVATLHDFWTICHREQLSHPDGRLCSGPDSVSKCAECYRRAGDDGRPLADDERPLAEDRPLSDGGTAAEDPDDWTAVARRTRRLRGALAATDRLVAPSAFLRETFEEYGTPPERIEQCRNGIQVERFEDTGFDPGAPLEVGYAGRITASKGVHLLAEAVREVASGTAHRVAGGTATETNGEPTVETRDEPAIECHVFGRFDPESDPYHARVAETAGEETTFHGWYADRPAPYRAVDVLVLPSVWYENSPLVIQEAFASGVPVVTADVGGMAELVSDGEDGLTVPVGEAGALADALARLAADPSLVADLRAGVTEPKRLDDHVEEVADLYAECAGRNRRT